MFLPSQHRLRQLRSKLIPSTSFFSSYFLNYACSVFCSDQLKFCAKASFSLLLILLDDREVAVYADPQTLRRLEDDYVGFWVQYRYEEGYGGQLSLGLNGAPFSADYAILRHNLDFSDS